MGGGGGGWVITVINLLVDFDVRDNRRWTFSQEEELLWIRILAGSN